MSLNHAILGLLTFHPMSGYTLKTRYFDGSIAHFWPADQAQIYRTLQALEASDLVVSDTVHSETRPNRRVYTITDTGRAALEDWLSKTQPIPATRDSFLVQLYFSRLLSRDQLLHVLRSRRADHDDLRQYFEELKIPAAENDDMERQISFGAMTLDYARRRERMMIEWLDACIASVEAMPSDSQ